MSGQIQIHGGDAAVVPSDVYRMATDAAGLCRQLVLDGAIHIKGKKYVPVSVWNSIAPAHGCMVSVDDAAIDEHGNCFATASLKRISDGLVLATARGMVGSDETTWASRPLFARYAMAQTRAAGRVLKTAFAHVILLIDRNLQTTPAEEMDGVAEVSGERVVVPQPATTQRPRVERVAPTPAPAPAPVQQAEVIPDDAPADGEKPATPVKYGVITPNKYSGEDIDRMIDDGKVKQTLIEVPKPCITEGKTAKGAWRRTAFSVDGERFGTFDTAIGAVIENMVGGKLVVYYAESVYPKGGRTKRDIVAVEEVTE